MTTYCAFCGENIYASSAAHVCSRRVDSRDAELATLRQKLAEAEAELKKCGEAVMTYVETVKRKNREIWAAEADCAAMREAMIGLQGGSLYMGRECHFGDHTGYELGHASKEAIGAFNAALTRPTGQAILDELSAARELIEAQSEDRAAYNPEPWKEEQHLRMQKAEERLSKAEERYDAARKANTGDKR